MSFSWRSVSQLEAIIIARREYWVLLAGSLAPRVSAFLNFSGVAGFGSGLQSAHIALCQVGWLATDGSKGPSRDPPFLSRTLELLMSNAELSDFNGSCT
ncbi:hypothetical protein CPAR01_09760 [Colletotrichum paranaense]|uniref:Uncharacterized protein n=3 Tax=Colletotrichum acutatum species complex TaxID=2707335 RepID=A0AAI9Z2L3_9PEZI|nr:uncharacterized protein CCOS01_04581 [Colletotrichum costaricense]XP_060348154.1 uncharacterized protein CPAR01_09760 [Colletotrichum paranaense]XP_060388727.1 uncharacterized protein CTAM01_00047 [Colletotrichum tamarilloi]KAI3531588.1 hypothetical protein CSPX01_14064 [Colletotrichum filicis]KAK1705498.1 hypothetical protein BDP67DRAFT_530966 [Colletotrichum lupini]KAK1512652.1 hypothetical protein CTAM01_00047 [Colletotrichum tamarilloi]KAK1532598.1 hypothetical protein CCOS01_04581 [Co